MQSTANQSKTTTVVVSSTNNTTTVISALPIAVQGVQDSADLANMSIGQLLGHGQRRVSVTQVATVAPYRQVSGGIQIIRPIQSGGVTMSQAQQQTASSSFESPSTSRPIVQLRVEGNRILSSPDLRQVAEQPKVTFITPTSTPLSRTPVSSIAQGHRLTTDSIRASPMMKPPTPALSEVTEGNAVNTGTLLDRARLDDLIRQIDPTSILEDPVKDALLEFIDDFVEQVIERTCQVSQHRGAGAIEAKDVEYVLDKYFKIPRLPKGNGIADLLKSENEGPYAEKRSRRADFTAHNQRLSVINKTIKKI